MKTNILITFSLLLLSLSWTGCTHVDDHYEVVNQQSVLEYISKMPEYSMLWEKIQGTEIEAILARNTIYTIFLPTNEAMAELESQQLTTQELVQTLSYHICNTYIPKYELVNKTRVRTIFATATEYDGMKVSQKDYKFISLTNEGNKIKADGIEIGEQTLLSNAVCYPITSIIKPAPSIWEYIIQNKDRYSYVYQYFKDAEQAQIDMENSVRIGFDENGQDVYDYYYSIKNSVFDVVGALNSERDQFTYCLFSDRVYDAAVESNPIYGKFSQTGKTKVLQDAIRRYTFKGLHEGLPISQPNSIGQNIDIKSSQIAKTLLVSNGFVHEFAEVGGLEIDFAALTTPITLRMDSISEFTTGGDKMGFIGGAVVPPAIVSDTLSNDKVVSFRRFQQNISGAARIPLAVLVNADDILPFTYTIRWKIINIGNKVDNFNWFQLQEYSANAGSINNRYSLVSSLANDSREQAKNFNIRLKDGQGNLIHTVTNRKTVAGQPETIGNTSMPIPFSDIRGGTTPEMQELYKAIKACDELYIEYDWTFDHNRKRLNKVLVGVSVELKTKSTATQPVYLDIESLELIPRIPED